MWSWTKGEPIKGQNLNDNFSLYEHRDGSLAWHLKVKRGNVEVSHNLLGLSKEAQIQGCGLRCVIFNVKNCPATDTKISKDYGVTETFRLTKELQLNPGAVKYKLC